MSDGTREETTVSVQIEELKRSVRALPFMTKLSPVRAHNGHGDGWRVSLRYSTCEEYDTNGPLKRMHTSDLPTTGCVSLVMLVMTQVVKRSSISVIVSARIIGVHVSTIKTLFSSSRSASTEWRRMCQD